MKDYTHVVYSSAKSHTSVPRFISASQSEARGFSSIYHVTRDTAETITAAGQEARIESYK